MIKKNIYTEFLKPKSIDEVIIYLKKLVNKKIILVK